MALATMYVWHSSRPDKRMRINVADFDPAIHVPCECETDAGVASAAPIAAVLDQATPDIEIPVESVELEVAVSDSTPLQRRRGRPRKVQVGVNA